MRTRGCEFAEGRKVTDFSINEETGRISAVICGRERYEADAVILAVGISTIQELIKNRYVVSQLSTFQLLQYEIVCCFTIEKTSIPK